MIDGLEFVELPEADWCCGLAGTQLITHYETSLKVLKRKTDNLASTQAGYVASGCPGLPDAVECGRAAGRSGCAGGPPGRAAGSGVCSRTIRPPPGEGTALEGRDKIRRKNDG